MLNKKPYKSFFTTAEEGVIYSKTKLSIPVSPRFHSNALISYEDVN